ncbi:MAG: hypothetical protein GY811_03875 [Myxococcales bacterium]|nr:hypothetical protein [Myxococcales bacterium]
MDDKIIRWRELPTGYGSAEGLLSLLDLCLSQDNADDWSELHNQVCHQGTPYGALWAVVPWLTSRKDRLSGEGLCWICLVDGGLSPGDYLLVHRRSTGTGQPIGCSGEWTEIDGEEALVATIRVSSDSAR